VRVRTPPPASTEARTGPPRRLFALVLFIPPPTTRASVS
jgi:hypothetical protein